jgi:hypothetical protein
MSVSEVKPHPRYISTPTEHSDSATVVMVQLFDAKIGSIINSG